MFKTRSMILLAALAAVTLTGCTRMGGLRARMAADELAHTVPIQGDPVILGRLNAVVVENPYGKVKVYAKPAHEQAHITFRVQQERRLRWRAARQGFDFDPVGEYFKAIHSHNGELSTLSVMPTDLTVEGYRPPIDLTVEIPQCDGIEVRNAGGKVIIVGVEGAINVVSGDEEVAGGPIEIRTDKQQVEEIYAMSNGGHVTLVTSPESAGTFELVAPRGKTSFSSRYGIVDHSLPKVGHWTGIWNDGTNAIYLESQDGDASVIVVENPVMHSSGKTW
ncbi:MAG: hypothetical protein NXI07_01540 [bacterium]|nr:hypothetical protein [bacterium]